MRVAVVSIVRLRFLDLLIFTELDSMVHSREDVVMGGKQT